MKTQITISILLIFLVFNLGIKLNAQQTALPVNEKIIEEEPLDGEDEEPTFSVRGFVDAYYQYHFQENAFPTSFTETHNSFTPGMANVVLSKEGKFGFVADLAVGPRAEVANGFEDGTTTAAIKQLFITYSPHDKLTFTFGNFGTHVGYEVIDSPDNINYSTSYMFSNGPFFHTGLKVNYAISENFGAMVGIFNDTDAKIDVVDGKHIGAQLSFSKNGFDAYLNYIGGKDDDSIPGNDIYGHQVDLTATYAINEDFGLGLNTTIKRVVPDEGENASWLGGALYINYALTKGFTLGLRGEYISDDDGLITGIVDNSVTSLTLSGNIHLGPITLIPELRADTASKDFLLDEDGEPTDGNAAFIFAAIYAF